MSINTENLFIKYLDEQRVIRSIESVWQSNEVLAMPNWTLPCNFDVAYQTKRVIAISPPMNGWIVLLESGGFIDFGLAHTLSAQFDAKFLIVQLHEAIGFSAYLYGSDGREITSHRSEDACDPLGTIRDALEAHDIPLKRPLVFQDCIRNKKDGWTLIRKSKAI